MREAIGAAIVIPLLLAGCDSDSETVSTGASTTTSGAQSPSTTAPTTIAPLSGAATTPTSVPAQGEGTALLTAVRAAGQAGYDRVVFEFERSAPGYAVEYVNEPFSNQDTGAAIPLEGSSLLRVRLTMASSVDLSGAEFRQTYSGPKRIKPDGTPVIAELVQIEDFEGTLVWGVGLRREAPFKVQVLQGPPRVVIDFAV